ncbi:hypothetical protein D0865_10606 [Hortaea werneckii]|uniref:RTA1 domain protein n=1 Tax=Hortaea werneckii TaxID=91943 RepID=A0A3M7BY66_HORWE|nr:hypothetical protein D0865_10606 [Hortaea werneckii]
MGVAPEGYEFYRYNPNIGGAVVFVIAFGAATAYHGWRAWSYRAKFFIAFVLGGLLETIGYIGRAASHNNVTEIGPYVVQNMFLLVAPALFAATIYMVLGRIIRLLHAEHHSVIKVTRLMKYFVVGDICCFWAQGQGGGLQAVGKPLFTTIGRWVVVGGLVLQVLLFGLFIVVAWKFHTRINRRSTIESSSPALMWRKHMRALYITSGLILARNIVRMIEYLQGFDGWIISHEAMLFIFDSVPMILVFVVLGIWHPCDLLLGNTSHAILLDPVSDNANLMDGQVVKGGPTAQNQVRPLGDR